MLVKFREWESSFYQYLFADIFLDKYNRLKEQKLNAESYVLRNCGKWIDRKAEELDRVWDREEALEEIALLRNAKR